MQCVDEPYANDIDEKSKSKRIRDMENAKIKYKKGRKNKTNIKETKKRSMLR